MLSVQKESGTAYALEIHANDYIFLLYPQLRDSQHHRLANLVRPSLRFPLEGFSSLQLPTTTSPGLSIIETGI